MTVQSQVRHFPAYAPIDESTRAELLDPGSAVLLAENVRPTEVGGYETRRGFGYQTLARLDATTRSAGYKQFAHGTDGKQTCVVGDGPTLDVMSSAAGVNISRGRLPECVLSMMDASSGGVTNSITITGAVQVGNYLCYAYAAATSTTWTHYTVVLDATTGAVVRAPETKFSAAAESFVLVAGFGATILQVFVEVGVANIKTSKLDVTSASTINSGWGAAQTPITNLETSSFAVAVESMASDVAIAYVNDSGGASQLTVSKLDGGAAVTQTQTFITGGATPDAVSVQSNQTDRLWIAFALGTTIKVVGTSPTNVTSVTSSTATVITCTATPSDLGIISSGTAGAGRLYAYESDRLQMRDFTTSAGVVATSGAQVTVFNVVGSSRPFKVGSRYYLLVQPYKAGGSQQKIAIVVDGTDTNAWLRPVANVAPYLVSAPFARCAWVSHSATEQWLPVSIASTGTVQGLSFAKLDFASAQRWDHVSHGEATFLGGGVVTMFDGASVHEAAFLHAPPKLGVADGAAGNLNGTYKYVAVYEYVDAAGNWHVSAVSEPATATPANKKVTITVRGLAITGRVGFATDTRVRVSIYRTGGAVGAAPYYYVSSIENQLGAISYTVTDDTADVSANAKLYAPSLPAQNGGSQEHQAPPGLTYLESGNDVLLGAQGDTLFGSSQLVVGEGIWWNPIWQEPVSGGGDITGIKFQDGTFFVFKRRSIFAVPAEAPSDNAGQGGLGVPRRLAVDVGCIDARSLVVTSLGIFFQSERGLELLTRAQSVEYVGQNVEKTLASYPVCSSATLDPIRNVVYFELAASQASGLVSGTGRSLVFDLTQKAWVSTDRRPKYDGTADTPAQSGCMVWDGSAYRYAWLQADGRVRPEQDAYYDTGSANAFIVPRVEYPPLKMGLQQRAVFSGGMVLVEHYSAAGLKIEQAYDWADYSSSDDKMWTESETSGKRQLEFRPKTGEHQSLKLRISGTAPVTLGTGRGFTFVGFSLDVATKQGSTKGTPHVDVTTRK